MGTFREAAGDLLEVSSTLARTCYEEAVAGAGADPGRLIKWLLRRAERELERGDKFVARRNEDPPGKMLGLRAVHCYKSAWRFSQWVMRWEGISPQLGASGETVLAFVHADHLGTPQKMTDESGAVVWSADYMPFGEAEVTVGGMENNIRFPGQYYDQETGLHYNYFRDYHPTIGRYLTPEPLSLSQMEIGRQSAIDVSVQSYGSPLTLPHLSNLLAINLLYQATLYNPQALNLYPYVHNNPILFVDPHGQFLQSLVAGGIAGGIVGGITFITDLAKGASFEDAAKSAVISGATSGVSVGLASTGLGFLVAGSAATATNAALQKIMNGDIELGRALFSGFATSAGGFALSGAGLQGATLGVVGGQIAAPVGLVGDVLFSSNAQDRQAPCK